jgi:hypothetical protein
MIPAIRLVNLEQRSLSRNAQQSRAIMIVVLRKGCFGRPKNLSTSVFIYTRLSVRVSFFGKIIPLAVRCKQAVLFMTATANIA